MKSRLIPNSQENGSFVLPPHNNPGQSKAKVSTSPCSLRPLHLIYCILSTSSTDFPFLNLTTIVYYALLTTYAVRSAGAEGLLGDSTQDGLCG